MASKRTTTSHLKHKERPLYMALDTNKRGMVELANDIPRLTISLWISNDNSYINKHRLAVPQKGHTLVTKMNDKINMD